ncbi:MAG: hypothetical protein R2788_06440 [Saprospiraceae bacterium]
MQITKAPIEKLTLPHGQMVVDQKKQAMIERVVLTSEDDIPQEYHNIAKDLLASSKPQEMMAALLMMHFGGKLNPILIQNCKIPTLAGLLPDHPLQEAAEEKVIGKGAAEVETGIEEAEASCSGRGERSFDRNEEGGERREGNSQTRRAEKEGRYQKRRWTKATKKSHSR